MKMRLRKSTIRLAKKKRYIRILDKQRELYLEDYEASNYDAAARALGLSFNQAMSLIYQDVVRELIVRSEMWQGQPDDRIRQMSIFGFTSKELKEWSSRLRRKGIFFMYSKPPRLEGSKLQIRTKNAFISDTISLVADSMGVTKGDVFMAVHFDLLIRNKFLSVKTGELNSFTDSLDKVHFWSPYRLPKYHHFSVLSEGSRIVNRFSPLLDKSGHSVRIDIRLPKMKIGVLQESIQLMSWWFGRSTENYLRMLYLCFLVRHNILHPKKLVLVEGYARLIRRRKDWKLATIP
jgi:hypothetical protein